MLNAKKICLYLIKKGDKMKEYSYVDLTTEAKKRVANEYNFFAKNELANQQGLFDEIIGLDFLVESNGQDITECEGYYELSSFESKDGKTHLIRLDRNDFVYQKIDNDDVPNFYYENGEKVYVYTVLKRGSK